MRRSWLLIVAVLLFPRPSAAQVSAVISGTVTDTAGRPIEGVTVSLERSLHFWRLRDITDDKGHYVLVGVPTDTSYNLVARRLGYREFTRPKTRGEAGHALIVNFTMFGRSAELDTTTVFEKSAELDTTAMSERSAALDTTAMSDKPLELEPITVTGRRRLFAKQLSTVTEEEIRGKGYLVTAWDVLRLRRPSAFTVQPESCRAHPWKLFVDSARMDFFFDQVSSTDIPRYLVGVGGIEVGWDVPGPGLPAVRQILGRLPSHEIESIELQPCTDRWRPKRYWNSIWVTTKRAYWLARKGPLGGF